MKKVIAMFAIGVLAACGSASTEVKADTAATTVSTTTTTTPTTTTDTAAKGGGVEGELSTEGKAEQTAVENIK